MTKQQLVAELERSRQRTDQLETELQQCTRRMHSIVRAASVGIGVIAGDVFQRVNDAWCVLTGYSESDLVGQSLSSLFPDPEIKEVLRNLQPDPATSETRETRLKHQKGHDLAVRVTCSRVEASEGEDEFVLLLSGREHEESPAESASGSETLLQSLINGIDESILMLDTEGRVLVINEEGARRNQTTPEEMRGKEVFSFMPPEVAKTRKSYFKKILRDRKAIRFRDQRPDGRVYNNLAYPIYNITGAIDRVAVIAQDITKRDQAQQDLLETKETLQALIEASPLPMIDLDLEGNVRTIWNRAAERTFGWSREEVLGKPLPIVPDGHQEEFAALRNRVENGELLMGIAITRRCKDGSPIHLNLSTAPLHDPRGKVVAIMSVLADVTQRKQAEEQLRKFKLGIERSGEAIFTTDPNGVIEYVNPAFTEIYGYTREEAIGRTPRLLKSGRHSRGFYNEFWETILSKQVMDGEIVNKTKSGDLLTIQASINPILNEENALLGFLAIQRDVTEQQQLEEQFRQSQKMESIGRLAGGVAHDLNNLLTPILGYSELLVSKLQENDTLLGYAQQIHHAADRSRDLTRQLLAFGRKQALKMQVINAASGITGFEKILRRTIREDIRLTFHYAPETGAVRVDQSQIGQVLLNLAVNAQDAMPEGGLLRFEITNVHVDSGEAKKHREISPGEYVMLTISDTGQGMDPEIRAHIFEPFFTTKRDGQGTGLGLATVYGIVKQHNGHILVDSEPGRGTTFRIYLPRVAENSADPEVPAPHPHASRGNETILVVEDNDMVRNYVYSILIEQGYQVLEAAESGSALDIVRAQNGNIDLLISDVIMPVVNGRELYNRIAADYPGMRVLYISGYTDDVISQHGVLEEGVSFLQKPFSNQQLLEKVREQLDTKGDETRN